MQQSNVYLSYHTLYFTFQYRGTQDECESVVSVTCSSCHAHTELRPNTSLALRSPLYPVLQPGHICEYELFMDTASDLSLEVEDISLPGHQHAQGHDSKSNIGSSRT